MHLSPMLPRYSQVRESFDKESHGEDEKGGGERGEEEEEEETK